MSIFIEVLSADLLAESAFYTGARYKYKLGRAFLNNKRYILFGLVGILCFMLIYLNKPNERDFVNWFKESYNIHCEDADCYVVTINNTSEALKDFRFWSADGYYDHSTGFLSMGMQTKRLYRNVNDSNQFFSIEVKGFWGDFEVIEIKQNKVNILIE